MNTSLYWHLSFWANAGHNISTVTITSKHCCRPSNQNYSSASSCIKQFESLARYSTILSLIFLNLESQLQNLIRILWTTHFRTLSEHFGLHTIAKTTSSCLIMKPANTFLFFFQVLFIYLFTLLSSVFRGLILLSSHIF